MKVVFLHGGTPLQELNFNPSIHYKFESLLDYHERIFDKKQLVNANNQMNSIKQEGIDVIPAMFDHRSKFKHFWISGNHLKELVNKEKAELVHATWGSLSGLLAVCFSPVPVVISFCGSDILGGYQLNGNKSIRSFLSIFFSQLSAFGASKIIAKSNSIKKAVLALNRSKVEVIPNGINLEQFTPMDKAACRKKLGWEIDNPILLFFGLAGQTVKNKPLATQTFEIVKITYPNAILKIVENVPFSELVYYYNAADLLLFTSFHEGSNNSIKEALACNLPIVSVDCGDVAERLHQIYPSYVHAAYDATILANSCISILQNPIRSNGSNHIQTISEKNIGKRILQLYQDVLHSVDKLS